MRFEIIWTSVDDLASNKPFSDLPQMYTPDYPVPRKGDTILDDGTIFGVVEIYWVYRLARVLVLVREGSPR